MINCLWTEAVRDRFFSIAIYAEIGLIKTSLHPILIEHSKAMFIEA